MSRNLKKLTWYHFTRFGKIRFFLILSLFFVPIAFDKQSAYALPGTNSFSGPRDELSKAWLHFQNGTRLFDEHRFGEALVELQLATAERRETFTTAGIRIEAIMTTPEGARAEGSISAAISGLAKKDIIDRDLAAIESATGGSLTAKAKLLRERRLSDGLSGFLGALLLVLDHRNSASLSDSLFELRKAAAELSSYPEAEYLIGRIYLAEGELKLAELQFLKALDQWESFEIPGDRFAVIDSLAAVYKADARWKEYEERLTEIVASSNLYREESIFLRDAMERSLTRDGFDRFMLLYRIEESATISANAELGEFYLSRGRAQAILHLAVAVNAILTKTIERLKVYDPSYGYRILPELLDSIESNHETANFARDMSLYRILHSLGTALSSQGHRETARGIFSALAVRKGIEPWNARARESLARLPR